LITSVGAVGSAASVTVTAAASPEFIVPAITLGNNFDNSGNVTYKYVTLDGVQKYINETVPSAFALGWGSTLLTNFQIDGLGGYGTAHAYIDKLTVYRW